SFYQLQDAAATIRNEMDEMSYDEGRLNEIELRLETLKQLKRKYGSTIKEIKAYYEAIVVELDMISNKESYLNQLQKRYDKAYVILIQVGADLTKKRREMGRKLEIEVQNQLKELYMDKATFQVVFK